MNYKPTSTPKQKQRILVVSSSNFFDVDKLTSTVVLAKILANHYGSIIDVFLNTPKVPKNLLDIVKPTQLNFVEKLTSDYFTLTLNRGNANIKEVKWEETKDKLKLLIFTEKGAVDTSKYSTEPGRPHYDQLFLLGIRDEDRAKKALGEFAPLLTASQTTNIDIAKQNTKYGQHNFVYPDTTCHAQAILNHAEEEELEITSDFASELLAAIYWKTDSLRNKLSQVGVFSSVQGLLERGAVVAEAVHKIYSTLSFAEVKARQEIYQNLKLHQNNIAISRISQETTKLLSSTNPILPSKNPLYKLKDAKASFVLVPTSAKETLVLTSSPKGSMNMKKMFSEFQFVGDNLQGEITFNRSIEDTEAEIIKKLKIPPSKRSKPTTISKDEKKKDVKPKLKKSNKPQSKDPLTPAHDPVIIEEAEVVNAPPAGAFGGLGQTRDPLPAAKN